MYFNRNINLNQSIKKTTYYVYRANTITVQDDDQVSYQFIIDTSEEEDEEWKQQLQQVGASNPSIIATF